MSSLYEHSPQAQSQAQWGILALIVGVLALLSVMLAPFGYFCLLLAWIFGRNVKTYAYGRHSDDPCWSKGRSIQRWAMFIGLVPILLVLGYGLTRSF
jgi:hypothetical protein